MIYNCIDIENNIKDIDKINENIKKCNFKNSKKIIFSPNDNEINNFIEKIKVFGNIYFNNFKFKQCPKNINKDRLYTISGENQNIITKTGSSSGWMGTICENVLENSKIYKWKIKILNSVNKCIMVGIAPIDFDINSSIYNYGWYLFCYDSTLYSGPPHNYVHKETNLNKVKDEVKIIMNMKKKTLKFIINNEDKGESYSNIPIDIPLSPAVLIYNNNDSIEILESN